MRAKNGMTVADAEALVASHIRRGVRGPMFVEALRLLIVALIEVDSADDSITAKGRRAADVAGTWARRKLEQHHGKA